MSVKVELGELAATLADFDVAYLVTVSDEGRAHVLSVFADPTADGLVVEGVGRHTQANAAAHPDVTLVFPPRDAGGYTLLVDGRASVDGHDGHHRAGHGDPASPGRRPGRAAGRQRLRRRVGAGPARADRRRDSTAAPALARLAARPRSVWSRIILRSRTERGVTSTHSSSAMNSSACSSDIGRGGISFSNVSALRPHVRELLLLRRVDVHVVGAGVLADDHPLVDDLAGADEQLAPLLQRHQRVRRSSVRGGRRRASPGCGRGSRRPTARSTRTRGAAAPCPRVSVSSSVRNPIRPRAGTR